LTAELKLYSLTPEVVTRVFFVISRLRAQSKKEHGSKKKNKCKNSEGAEYKRIKANSRFFSPFAAQHWKPGSKANWQGKSKDLE
jgi:hypothetical protein